MLKKLFFITFSMMVNAQLWAIDAPTLSSPSPDYQNAYTRIVLKGENGKNDGYHLQVDTTTRFNSPLLHEETWSKSTTSFSSTVTDLHFNCHYYWRVRSVSPTEEGVFSDWSEVRDFYTNHPVEIESPNDPEHSANYYPQVDLKWKNHLGSGTYVFEIDTVPSFTSPGKIREQWSESAPTKEGTTSHTVSNLYLGKTIYWHVRLMNKNDSSQWSETASFHTVSKAVGKFPDGLTSAYTTQNFEWKYQRGLTNVIIELDTTPAFNSPAKRTELSWGSNQDNCYTPINHLLFGATYYWRIKSYHQKDTTQWSDVLTFTTYDFCTLSSPSDSAVNRYTSGKISWRYSKGISTYQVQLDTVPTFNSPVLISKLESAGNDDNAYYSYSQLYFGKWYYWRVRECHKNDTSKWSKTRCFKTYRHCNLNTTPTDSATNVSTSPELYFTYATGVSNYQQQIDTTPSFDSPLCETKMSTGASGSNYNYHSFIDLLFGTRYYRRVRECLPHDTTDWSPIRSFTTIEKGAYSTSYSIAKGETNVSITPELYYAYRNYIDSVEVQLDTTIRFDSPLFESHRMKEASAQKYAYVTPNNNLLYGTTYYWRIRDIHSKDISDWTTPRYFTTTYRLPKPNLIGPVNQSTIYNGDLAVFNWDKCEDATQYVFQLSDDGQFNTCLHQELVTDTVTSMVLPDNSILYWRVQAVNSQGRSPWSDVRGINTISSMPTETIETSENRRQTKKQIRNGRMYIVQQNRKYDILGIKIHN